MKTLTTLFLTAVSSVMLAQIPNPCFTTWSGGANNSPTSWETSNIIASGSASESFTVHGSCATSAALNSVVNGGVHYGGSIVTWNGHSIYFLYTGGSNPVALNGWYQLTTSGGDELRVTAASKGGAGAALAVYSTATGVWKQFSACFVIPSGIVDSVSISFSLTNSRGNDTTSSLTSIATVDDLSFGTCAALGVDEVNNNVTVEPSYPNPANNICNIIFSIPCSSTVNVALYDLNGRKVLNALENTTLSDGRYKVPVDVTTLANGVYFYTVTVNGMPYTQKLVVAKQ